MHSRPRTPLALGLLTALTLCAFAANSLLCRAALGHAGMDAASFTAIRLASGAVVLAALVAARGRGRGAFAHGSWTSAVALLAYAALFSFAYRSIPAGVGALVLFAAVQFTMLTSAVRAGTGPRGRGWIGVALAGGGLVALTLPGATAPDPVGVAAMAASGVAWGVYSVRGARETRAVDATSANFVRAAVLALPVCGAAAAFTPIRADARSVGLAATSGAVTSGLGYVLWYAVLPALGTTRAAVLQLAVPVLATLAGVALLAETLTARLAGASAAILGGIALVLRSARRAPAAAPDVAAAPPR